MAEYRLAKMDLATRIQIACEVMRPAREHGWGWATQQARACGVSRQLLTICETKPKRYWPQGYKRRCGGSEFQAIDTNTLTDTFVSINQYAWRLQ